MEMYGTNDTVGNLTNFTAELTAEHTAFRLAGLRSLVTGVPFNSRDSQSLLLSFNVAKAGVARTLGLPYADVYWPMVDTGSPASLMTDTLHYNASGGVIVATAQEAALRGQHVRNATLDFPSIASLGYQDLTVSVPGARANDLTTVTAPAAVYASGLTASAWVSANDTVTVRLNNPTASAVDPASGTYLVNVQF